ncbi:Ankyrin repeat family protein isoform 1 [Hibiscus syriacus]|uniref:Exocyst subunit Exo70 family protein n=1 Tax=Hibiscus syriacus TaxID=106335 RepID=A0A6A3CUA8_HIBSY|nr:Ankyrin repeat family protein isoform 1 [Hibiscus syriacus]
MPTKGMRSICFSPRTPSFSISRQSTSHYSSSTPRRRFSDSMIDQTIDAAASIIMKWDTETSAYAKVTSLFYESKREALQFIRSVNDLQKTMHLLISVQESSSEKLIRAQNLMQIAMKRLQKEFYQILSMNRAHLDPESVSIRSSLTSARSSISDFDDDSSPDDEIRKGEDSITEIEKVSSMAISDLKLIANLHDRFGSSHAPVWISRARRKDQKVSAGESIPSSQHVLLHFRRLARDRNDLLFRIDFSRPSTSSQLAGSTQRVCSFLLMDFESAIQKDSSKMMIPGGGLHPLTTTSMNYLSLLADYSNVLADIIADWPPPVKSSLPAPFLYSPESDDSSAPAISVRIAWLILVLLYKLDGKAKHYKDISLAYLFLANNLQHVISRVRTSNLRYILGEEWITKHEAKVKQFAENYEQLAWGEVSVSLPENPTAPITPGKAKDHFRKFNSSFEVAYWKQSSCVIPDSKLRDEIKVSIGRKLVALYRDFYNTHRSTVGDESMARLFVRFSPEDIGNYKSDLFFGTASSGSSSTSCSVSSHHLRKIRSPLRV